MPSDGESSDLSSLSSLSPAPSHDDIDDLSDIDGAPTKSGILKFFPKLSDQAPREPSPPPRKRSPSPPHEYVLADNPDIAVRLFSYSERGLELRQAATGSSTNPTSRATRARIRVTECPGQLLTCLVHCHVQESL